MQNAELLLHLVYPIFRRRARGKNRKLLVLRVFFSLLLFKLLNGMSIIDNMYILYILYYMPELPRILPRPLENRLATGTEKTVYTDGVGGQKVLKTFSRKYEDAKANVSSLEGYDKEKWKQLLAQEFYLTKIVRLLFPDTIADIHMVSVASDVAPQSLHERVTSATDWLDKLRNIYAAFMDFRRDSDKARDITDAYWDAGVALQFTKDNFTYDQQRRLLYVDSVTLQDIDKLEQVIGERLSGDELRRASAYLGRLRQHMSK
jgi:hypothetical protein